VEPASSGACRRRLKSSDYAETAGPGLICISFENPVGLNSASFGALFLWVSWSCPMACKACGWRP
jgi:hypothetical protein